jgi:UTP--glucose-1-phosphate uridylyltransferase
MNIRKAVITAAGRGQRALPLQTLVDRDGLEKTALQILLEEVMSAGIEEIGIVVAPGDQKRYAEAAGSSSPRLQFIEQREPRGYGHALSLARSFTGQEPFLHLISDHLYLSRGESLRCAQQVVEQARSHGCSVSAVQATRESMLPYYGTLGGRRVPRAANLYEIDNVLEKPTPSEAEQKLHVPGLRAGYYICFFGIHVFTPLVLELLEEAVAHAPAGQSIQLSPVLARLASRDRYLALEVRGQRYDIGIKYGFLMAQLALALNGLDRENVLAQMVDLLAVQVRGQSS